MAGSAFARPGTSAAGVGAGGTLRPQPLPGGQPSYYLPGGRNIPDPNFAANQSAYNSASGGYASFLNHARTNPNFSMSYTDPRDGTSLRYDPSNRGGGAGGASGDGYGLEDFDFESALRRVQPALPPVPPPAHMPDHVNAPSPADSAAAEAAEFGRAKDKIGRLGRGSQNAIAEEFSARGLGGSNMEGAATQGLLSDLQGQEGEVIRDQTIQNLVRQRQVEDRNYAGDLNQRGQDIGFTTSTRGQDIDAAQGRAQLQVPLMQLIAANRRRMRLY